MLLTGDENSIELRLLGWESELEAGDQRNLTDWVDIQGVVTDSAGTRVHHVALDVEDALRIAPWLRHAAGVVPPSDTDSAENALLTFVEPGFAVELISRDQLRAVTHWYFYDPDGQVLELLAFNVRVERISCTRTDLLTGADEWADELASLMGG